MLNCEIVSEVEAVLVTVNDFVEFCPLTMLPKLKLAGETDNPACTLVPVPLNATVIVGCAVSLLAIVNAPVAAP
jgi:hypothetical protein